MWGFLHTIPERYLAKKSQGLQLLPNFSSTGKPLKQSHLNRGIKDLPDDQYRQERTFQSLEQVKD